MVLCKTAVQFPAIQVQRGKTNLLNLVYANRVSSPLWTLPNRRRFVQWLFKDSAQHLLLCVFNHRIVPQINGEYPSKMGGHCAVFPWLKVALTNDRDKLFAGLTSR